MKIADQYAPVAVITRASALRTMLMLACIITAVVGADKPESQKPSMLVAQTFVIYYTTPATNSAVATAHRSVLVFGTSEATCELFPGNTKIPYTATVKTQQTSGKGKTKSRTILSDFTAHGETELGNGTISFTASKDGTGAKGTITLTEPNKPSVTIPFTGNPS